MKMMNVFTSFSFSSLSPFSSPSSSFTHSPSSSPSFSPSPLSHFFIHFYSFTFTFITCTFANNTFFFTFTQPFSLSTFLSSTLLSFTIHSTPSLHLLSPFTPKFHFQHCYLGWKLLGKSLGCVHLSPFSLLLFKFTSSTKWAFPLFMFTR